MELVLATLISSLVIGILSVGLSFSLRVWEKRQNQKRPDVVGMLEILKWQIASYDPVTIKSEGESFLLFQGEANALTITTDYSVKSLSKGAPVIARYVYIPAEKTVYYAEIPLDPYHPKQIQEFTRSKPGRAKSWPQFYAVPAADFSLTYAGEERGVFNEVWSDTSRIPSTVLVRWSSQENGSGVVQAMIPNFLFAKTVNKTAQQQQVPGIGE